MKNASSLIFLMVLFGIHLRQPFRPERRQGVLVHGWFVRVSKHVFFSFFCVARRNHRDSYTQKVQVWVQTYNSSYQSDLPYPIQGGYRSCSFKRAINPTDMYSTNYDNSWILSYPIFVIATEDETQLYLENGTVTLNQPTNRQSAAKKYYLCPLFHETSLKLCKSARPSTTTPSIRCRMSP